jgi:hypothetical protein
LRCGEERLAVVHLELGRWRRCRGHDAPPGRAGHRARGPSRRALPHWPAEGVPDGRATTPQRRLGSPSGARGRRQPRIHGDAQRVDEAGRRPLPGGHRRRSRGTEA